MVDKNRRSILLVDDDKAHRTMLKANLAGDGFTVLEADDGDQVLDKLAQHNIDLILLDIMMPGIDGYELCMKIREEHDRDMVPIVFLTSCLAGTTCRSPKVSMACFTALRLSS